MQERCRRADRVAATGLARRPQVSCLAVSVALSACLLVLLALGLAERLARDRAWRAVPVRVHVNGSRGKSTVTRLVWSALREAGIPAIGKTTGTAARLLLPDGTEQPWQRRSPASIREQLALLREARRRGVRAMVVECMALDPELQWVSERQMVRATLGVVTNVRLDHAEIMGTDLSAIAASLANTVPPGAVVVCGDDRFLPVFEARAAALGARVVSTAAARRHALPPGTPAWLAEDIAIALTVTRELGIDDEAALRGFAAAPPDPGAARSGTLLIDDRRHSWLDATAANDPDSLARLLVPPGAADDRAGKAAEPDLVIYNHRADRSPRLACFARHSATLARAPQVVVTGDRPPWSVWRHLRRARPQGTTCYVATHELREHVRRLPSGSALLFCGNTRGLDLFRLFEGEVHPNG